MPFVGKHQKLVLKTEVEYSIHYKTFQPARKTLTNKYKTPSKKTSLYFEYLNVGNDNCCI